MASHGREAGVTHHRRQRGHRSRRRLTASQAGHRVLLGCRDRARGGAAAEQLRLEVTGADVSVLALDMSSQGSIREAAARVDRLDVLVHNAAYFDIRAKSRTETPEGIETTWATNYLGPALLTELLLPRLQESDDARVIAVTSKGLMMFPRLAVDLADPELESRRFSVPRAYYQSKLAHLAWMLTQAERWRASRIRFHGVRVTNVKFLRRRVHDGVLLRLIGKWLNAGVLEDGSVSYPEAGTPQGGVVSPMLANIFLREVLDVWFDREVKPRLAGKAALFRYADDAVFLFANEMDARRVMAVLPKRLGKYGLELHPDKTRLVNFRRPDRFVPGTGAGRRPRADRSSLRAGPRFCPNTIRTGSLESEDGATAGVRAKKDRPPGNLDPPAWVLGV